MPRSEYLKECIRNARSKLAMPNVRYQNGRMSHDVQSEFADKCQEELWDLQLQGRFYADGTFAGSADDPKFAHLKEA